MTQQKHWYDSEYMTNLYAKDFIHSDEDVAQHFRDKGYLVSRRAITDARNQLGISAKSKNFPVYEVELESPKILFLDIETRPNLGYFWRLYDENIGINQLIEEHQLLSFAAKWRGRETLEFYSEYHHGHDQMVLEAYRLLDEADIIVHWNGKKFDIPHLNKEFVLLELDPPSSFKQIDLMLTARSQFKFISNKLQHISTALGLEGKFGHEGFDLWVKCMAGDPEAWEIMQTYNQQDVVLLEQIYDKILPWIKNHPNVALYKGVGCCPNCGSDNIQSKGLSYTNVRTYEKFKCNECGAWMRGTKFKDAMKHVQTA